jgi:peptide subunit release factor 1 (eRF1)
VIFTENVSEFDLKELAGFSPEDSLVVSLYLDVDGAKYPRVQEYEKTLHNLINQARQDWVSGNHLEEKEKRKSVQQDLDLIQQYVTGQWRRNGTKGLAVFSCLAEDFWQVYELPATLPSALIVGREPYAKILTAFLNKYERFCVVSVDRKKSRLFTVHLGAIEEEHGVLVDEWVPDQVKEGEWAGLRQSRIERHIDDHVMRHLKDIANRAYDFFVHRNCDYLVISGHEEVLPKFKQVLHPYLQERLVGDFYLDPAAPAKDFLEHTLQVESRVRHEQQERLLRRLEEESASGGLGVTGLADTLDALVRGQVDTLMVSENFTTDGFVCYDDHYLGTEAGDCPICGQELSASEDIVEDMVQVAINHNVRVEYIVDELAFPAEDKVGALLRYEWPRAATETG